jgi:hypothetical protein
MCKHLYMLLHKHVHAVTHTLYTQLHTLCTGCYAHPVQDVQTPVHAVTHTCTHCYTHYVQAVTHTLYRMCKHLYTQLHTLCTGCYTHSVHAITHTCTRCYTHSVKAVTHTCSVWDCSMSARLCTYLYMLLHTHTHTCCVWDCSMSARLCTPERSIHGGGGGGGGPSANGVSARPAANEPIVLTLASFAVTKLVSCTACTE